MKYDVLKNVVALLEEFEQENASTHLYHQDIAGFKRWIAFNYNKQELSEEPSWEGKENGRSAESVISTLIVHMNRYAKSYSKSAIFGSNFSTQEDFIYLINLKARGEMSKMDLIKKNVHEKPTGMQIINRLIKQGWVDQQNSQRDKRSKVLKINAKGLQILDLQMEKIRKATMLVSADLTQTEKMDLIRLLNKLNDFHQAIYNENIESEFLLDTVLKK